LTSRSIGSRESAMMLRVELTALQSHKWENKKGAKAP